ncbi:MAG: CcmD family protein [Actinomycetota bacterium]|nr:CcmD family protein [Actinomycetota bacterium]
MSNLSWLFVAFAVVWVAIGVYLWSLGTRQRTLERRLEDLERHDARARTTN